MSLNCPAATRHFSRGRANWRTAAAVKLRELDYLHDAVRVFKLVDANAAKRWCTLAACVESDRDGVASITSVADAKTSAVSARRR